VLNVRRLPVPVGPPRLAYLVAIFVTISSHQALVLAQCTPLDQACESVPIDCNATTTARIDVAGERNFHRLNFEVGAGEIIEVVVAAIAPAAPTFRPAWRLLDQVGTPVAPCDSFAQRGRVDCGPLATAGNPYRIEVGDAADANVGTYQIFLQRLTVPQACLGNFKLCNIDPPTDTDLLSFTVDGMSEVEIQVNAAEDSGENFEPYWRVLDAAGLPTKRCGAFTLAEEMECGVLPATGNPYRIEVTDFFNDAAGEFTAFVNDAALCTTPAPSVTFAVGTAYGAPGTTVGVDVTLSAPGNESVVTTQNCIGLTHAAPVIADAGGNPTCAVNPAIHKDASSFVFTPSGCTVGVDCAQACASIFALDNMDPIPDGATLYSCALRIADDTESDRYPLVCSEPVASDPDGKRLGAQCTDGTVDVGICVGDCNGDGSVTVDELVLGVDIALGTIEGTQCPRLDRNADGKVTIDELVVAVSNALNGCA